jgi:FkbM family methyltransferase
MLRKAGWEVHRINKKQPLKRSSMAGTLHWLSSHQFEVRTVLDVGASDGRWSELCMNFFPEAKYVLFEPQPVHSDALDMFAKASSQAVAIVRKAVGGSEGHTFFDASDPLSGALAQNDKGNNIIDVELTTIDASVSQYGTAGPYLLKLDTHGYEKPILEGAGNTLEKAEILIIEAYNHRIADGAFLFWELCAFLSGKGFRPVDLVDVIHRVRDDSLWQIDLVFVKSAWSGFNKRSYE